MGCLAPASFAHAHPPGAVRPGRLGGWRGGPGGGWWAVEILCKNAVQSAHPPRPNCNESAPVLHRNRPRGSARLLDVSACPCLCQAMPTVASTAPPRPTVSPPEKWVALRPDTHAPCGRCPPRATCEVRGETVRLISTPFHRP